MVTLFPIFGDSSPAANCTRENSGFGDTQLLEKSVM